MCTAILRFAETRLPPALNDILIAHPSPAAVSRFRLSLCTGRAEPSFRPVAEYNEVTKFALYTAVMCGLKRKVTYQPEMMLYDEIYGSFEALINLPSLKITIVIHNNNLLYIILFVVLAIFLERLVEWFVGMYSDRIDSRHAGCWWICHGLAQGGSAVHGERVSLFVARNFVSVCIYIHVLFTR